MYIACLRLYCMIYTSTQSELKSSFSLQVILLKHKTLFWYPFNSLSSHLPSHSPMAPRPSLHAIESWNWGCSFVVGRFFGAAPQGVREKCWSNCLSSILLGIKTTCVESKASWDLLHVRKLSGGLALNSPLGPCLQEFEPKLYKVLHVLKTGVRSGRIMWSAYQFVTKRSA